MTEIDRRSLLAGGALLVIGAFRMRHPARA